MKLHKIFIGKPTEVEYQEHPVLTGIFKYESPGPLKVSKLNIEGDQQEDLTVHGGYDKAVYAYPIEHYEFWENARTDLEFAPGVFGENLSVDGLIEDRVFIGDRFRIGDIEVQVTSPRLPCFKLGIKMGDPRFIKDFMNANKTGFYFRVIKEGQISPGDVIEKIGEDGHALSVSDIVKLYSTEKDNKDLLRKAADSPSLPEDWREFFAKRL